MVNCRTSNTDAPDRAASAANGARATRITWSLLVVTSGRKNAIIGIDDDEFDLMGDDGAPQRLEGGGERRIGAVVHADLGAAQTKDAVEVGAGGVEARPEGVVEAVLGVEEEDVGLLAAPGAVGRPSAAGEAGGQVGGEKRLAGAGVAVQQGKLAASQIRPPEPADGPNRHAVETETVGIVKRHGRHSNYGTRKPQVYHAERGYVR